MRALLLAALLCASAGAQSLYPVGWKPISISKWGGLNLLQDSSMIEGDAQSAVNVLTDNTYLEKRPGNVRLATILPGYAVQYVNDWVAPSGSRYLIAQSSSTIYQTNFSGSPVALSTVAIGFNITTTPAFSKLEFADGVRPLWYWDGNSTATVKDASGNLAPVCTYIAFKDSRIWCANLPNGFSIPGNTQNGGGSSTVLVSSSGADNYWSVPPNVGLVDSTPNRWDLNPNDGDQITCLSPTPWGMFVGKRNSSYMVKGNGNLSYDPRLLDPKIGCVDNRSVQMVNGVLMWLAVDGVYGYVGSGPPQIMTRDLDPLMQQVREATFSQGQWATQLQGDWATGTQSTTAVSLPAQGPWDFNTIPGTIYPSSGTLYDDNTSPSLQTCSTNINPANSLPWACGVGFSSDTLVNIDTTSFPLSIGFAQAAPSSSGIGVWYSTKNFAASSYTTGPTTWTLDNGTIGGPGGCIGSFPGVVGLSANSNNNIYTMAASSGVSAGGWNFGYWSVSWGTYFTGSATYGRCFQNNGNACMEYDFIANNYSSPSSAWSGYGIRVDGDSSFTLSLFKSVAGVKTTLASTAFAASGSNFTIFTIKKTVGGDFVVAINGVDSLVAHDNTTSANSATVTALGLGRFDQQGVGAGCNFSGGAFMTGYSTGSILSRIIDTGSASPLAGVLSSSYTLQGVQTGNSPESEIDFYVRDSTSPNNDMWSSWQASSNSVLAVLPERYWQYEALFTSRIASATVRLGSVELSAVTTGYYYSKVNFVGSLITAWTQFGVTENNPGTYGYAVRQSTNPTDLASTLAGPSWVAQTANQNVNLSVSTPTYAQFRLDSTALTSNPLGATAAEPISAVFLRWNQGANLPVASDTLERRYMVCVTVSTNATAPDTCLIRQKTGKWVQWSNGGTIGAMGLYNNQMVAADGGTSSKVWSIMQPNVYSDDGVPISASWIGVDEVDGLPFNKKDYYGVMIDALPVQASSATFSYQVNKSSGFVSQVFSLDSGQALDPSKTVIGSQYGAISQWLSPVSGYNQGNYIRVQFSDATLGDYFRINDYTFFVIDEPWMPP